MASLETRGKHEKDAQAVGSGGAPGIGGVTPGEYVDTRGDVVPVGMPEEILLSGGTPFRPVGTDNRDEFVTVNEEPVPVPVPVLVDVELSELGEGVEEEGEGPVLLAGERDGEDEWEGVPELVLLVGLAASWTWRR